MTDSDRVYQLSKSELQNVEQYVGSTPENVFWALESRNLTEMRRAIRFIDRMSKDAPKLLADIRTHQERAHRCGARLARLMYICRMHNIFITTDDLDSDEPVAKGSLRMDPWPPPSVGSKLRRRHGREKWVLGDDGRWHSKGAVPTPSDAEETISTKLEITLKMLEAGRDIILYGGDLRFWAESADTMVRREEGNR